MGLGLSGGGSGWFCAGYECFWGGYQWLSVVTSGYGVFLGCFWMVMGGNGSFKIITTSFVKLPGTGKN